eukprot:3812669-Amphidinium_carterae.1
MSSNVALLWQQLKQAGDKPPSSRRWRKPSKFALKPTRLIFRFRAKPSQEPMRKKIGIRKLIKRCHGNLGG